MRLRSKGAHLAGLTKVSADSIYEHVFGNADREVGGVLVGRVPREDGLPLITGAIPAVNADEQRATLTFTQDAWQHFHQTLDSEFPEDEQIVGWYHSHPGFGIFLSGHDLFIHRNFFSGPSQVALVVDPIAATEGVFVWRDGDVQLLFERDTPPGWEPDPPVRRPVEITPEPEVENAAVPPERSASERSLPLRTLVVGFLAGLVLAVGIWLGFAGGSGSPSRASTNTGGHTTSTTPGNTQTHARTTTTTSTTPTTTTTTTTSTTPTETTGTQTDSDGN